MLLLFHPRGGGGNNQFADCSFLFISVNYPPRDKRDESRRLTDWLKCDTRVSSWLQSWQSGFLSKVGRGKVGLGFSFIVIKWVFSNFLTLNDLVHRSSMLTDRSNPSPI